MKFYFLIIFTLLFTNYLLAQPSYLGVKAGLGLNNITFKNTLKTTNYLPTFNAGITFEKLFKNKYFLGVDFMHQTLGFIEPFSIINNFGKTTGETGELIYHFGYVNLPLYAGIYQGTKWKKIISIAIIPGMLINAKTTVPAYKTNGKQKEEQSFDVSNQPNQFDFSGQINLGIGRNINNKTFIYGLAGFQRSFTALSNDDYFLEADLKHFSFSIAIGVKYVCF